MKTIAVIFALIIGNGIYGGLTALIVFGINEIFGKAYSYAIPISIVCVLISIYIVLQALIVAIVHRQVTKEINGFPK